MKKTVVLRKVNLLAIFLRLAVTLVTAGVIIGILLGIYLNLADTEGSVRWSIVPKAALIVGAQGLALTLLITLMAAKYNVIVSFIARNQNKRSRQ